MLDINIEFTRGILFVRLKGFLDNSNIENVENKVTEIIKDGGIRFLVFNIQNLKVINGFDMFKKCNDLVKINDGRMLLCGVEEDSALSHFSHVDNELLALKTISVC